MTPREELTDPSTTPERLRQLAEQSAELHFLIICHPGCPDALIERLLFAAAPYSKIRYEAAQSPQTPPAILARLVRDPNISVRLDAVKNPSTPTETLRQLLQAGDWYMLSRAAQNLSMPPELLTELSTHTYESIRESVASNTSTPEKTLLQMLKRERSDAISQKIAQNPRIGLKNLRNLAQKTKLLSSLVMNPSCDAALLEQIATQSTDEPVLALIAGRPKTPAHVLAKLAESELASIRRQAAKNPNLGASQQELFAKDPSYELRWAVAENPKLAQPLLALLSTDKHWGVRWMVAQNPGSPVSVLSQLLSDQAMEVRQAAEANLKKNHPE